MKKTLQVFCILLLVVFVFAKLEAATKTVIEKDAQGNELKKTIIETDKLGNETTTIINQQPTTPSAVQAPAVTPQPAAPVASPVVPKPVVKKELKKGSNILYGRLGLAMPLNSPDGKIYLPSSEPLDMSWGTLTIELGATYLHFLSDYIAVGGEFGLDLMLPKTDSNSYFDVNQSTVFANFLLLTHIYLNNPKEEARFYIPIGIGFGSASYTLTVNNESVSASGSGGCYVIGIGTNWRTQTGNLTGAEIRYTASGIDGNEPDSLKDQNISILSLNMYYGFDF
ncbi:MAG: hypothetical protein PHR82_01675 [Endomicrobiaceae bacterium]|nr:hypothetical protein [Endomicrobiaceae bacterium]